MLKAENVFSGMKAIKQVSALLHWPARIVGVLGMAQHQLIRMQLRRPAPQKMQRQSALGRSDINLGDLRHVCGQAIEYQMRLLLAKVHQLFEKFHERLVVELYFVGDKTKGAFDVFQRDGADLLISKRTVVWKVFLKWANSRTDAHHRAFVQHICSSFSAPTF